jgi:hypothetical protein
MSVFSANSTRTLYGTSPSTFALATASPTTGAKVGTAQWLGAGYFLSDLGIQQSSATQSFGDFQLDCASGLIQPLMNRYKGTATASCALKEKNQYRLFFSGGYCVSMGLASTNTGVAPSGFMLLNYGIPVRCITTGLNSSGREVVYFGSDDGYVYQDGVGTSFDGSAIESWLRFPYNHMKSPRHLKTFRKASLDITVEQYATIRTSYDLSGGSFDFAVSDNINQTMTGAGGYWDQFTWDQFTWDTPIVTTFDVQLGGTAKNIGILLYGNSATDWPYSIQGAFQSNCAHIPAFDQFLNGLLNVPLRFEILMNVLDQKDVAARFSGGRKNGLLNGAVTERQLIYRSMMLESCDGRQREVL